MRTQLRTFGLELDNELKAQAQAQSGFVRFVDNEYFEVELQDSPTDKDFVYFKRNNGEIVVQ